MRKAIRYGGVLRCDMVTISEDGTEHTDACQVVFTTYSLERLVRRQALDAGWVRALVRRVKWPGRRLMDGNRKVDLCPQHACMVMTADEARALRATKKATEERIGVAPP